MPDKSSDVVQGALDMLVLKTLALGPMHGYGISVRIEQMSKGVFVPMQGRYFSQFSGYNATDSSMANGRQPRTTAARSITF